MTGRPRSRTLRMRSSTMWVSLTPSAAVGSSMITTWRAKAALRATATPCRCPPDSVSTAWPIDRMPILRSAMCRRDSASILRAVEADRLAVQEDLALVGDEGARERLDEGRLAGAVVADDGLDLAGEQLEVAAVQGGHLAVALDQAARLQDGGRPRLGRRRLGHCCLGHLACLLRASWSTATARMTRMPVMRTW